MNDDVEQWQLRQATVTSDGGMVAAQHHLAAKAGAAMLHRGGNAVDAAVACAFALNAVEPWMCGLGGSGYLVVWLAGRNEAQVVDFQGMLPAGIRLDDYPLDPAVPASIMGFPGVRDGANVVGYRSITVPGAVAGLSTALERFGRLSFDTVLGPAIALARRGLPVDWFATLQIALEMVELRRDPGASSVYLPDGAVPRPEQLLPLGALPATLERLAEAGPDDFYRGRLAEAMVADLQAGGSRIDGDDLAAYAPLVHQSLSGTHRGATVHTAGPTSGGPRLLEALGYLDRHLEPEAGVGSAAYLAFADALDGAFRSHKQRLGILPEGGCTSHMSAIDGEGNLVALTYTLLNRFGSKVVLPRTGVLLNNAVSYFDPRPGYPTTMEGRKRINSSNMCPTVAVRDGGPLFAVGASGANHIVPCTFQVAAFMLHLGLSLEEAMNLPRIDASDRGGVRADPRVGPEVLAALGALRRLEVAQRLVFPKLYSCPSGVWRDPVTGRDHGLNDPSQPIGGAAGPAPFALDGGAGEGPSVRA